MLCNKCGQDKAEDRFEYRKVRGKHRKTCKDCKNESSRTSYSKKSREIAEKRKIVRNTNLDELNAKARQRYWKNRGELLKKARERIGYKNRPSDSFKAWRIRNKEKCAAHQSVSRALKNGKMLKADKCALCGKGEKLNAHHNDYTKPLDITWLCIPCHKKVHSKYFKEDGADALS